MTKFYTILSIIFIILAILEYKAWDIESHRHCMILTFFSIILAKLNK